MVDRRCSQRIPLSRPIYVEMADGQVRQTRAIDLSCSGIGILCIRPLPMDLTVTLRFSVGVQALQEELVVRATVRHVYMRNDWFVMGLQFVDMGARELERIRELVEHKLRLRVVQGLA